MMNMPGESRNFYMTGALFKRSRMKASGFTHSNHATA